MLSYEELLAQASPATDAGSHGRDLAAVMYTGGTTGFPKGVMLSLYIVDRVKDMIVTGGENVYSAEVENALAQHTLVAQSAVIAIPSEQWGEAVHAVVVLKADADSDAQAGRPAHRALPSVDRRIQVSPQRGVSQRTAHERRGQDPENGAAQTVLGRQGSRSQLTAGGATTLAASRRSHTLPMGVDSVAPVGWRVPP